MKEKKRALLWEAAVLLLALCVLGPLLINGWFDRPSADDYDYAVLTHEAVQSGGGLPAVLGAALRTVGYYYQNWQGTYTSAFVMSLQPGIWGEKMYRVTPVIVLLLVWLGLFGSAVQLNRRLTHKPLHLVFTASVAALALIYVHLPSAAEGLYWYNGAMHYMPPTALSLLCAVSAWEASCRLAEGAKGGRLRMILSGLLALILSGTSYVSVLFNIMLLLALVIGQLARKQKPRALAVLLCAAAGFAVSAMAPGTAVRQGNFEQLGLIGSMVTTLKLVLASSSFLFTLQWALAMLAGLPVAAALAQAVPEDQLPRRFPSFWLLYSAAVYCAMVCVLVFSTGFTETIWPGRCRDAFHFGFLLLTWADMTLILCHRRAMGGKLPALRGWAVALALLLTFLPGADEMSRGPVLANPVQVLVDYHYARPVNYVIQMDQRFADFHDPSLTEVAVEPLKVTETMVFFSDITEDYEELLSNWYGKRIYLTAPSEDADSLDPFHLGGS